MKEIYFSTDIEADGPIPGPHSMLSLGSAAFTEDNKILDTFSVNLVTLEGSSPHPETTAWWKTQPLAWEACRKNLQDPKEAMSRYVAWITVLCKTHKGKAVFVGYPATFDFMFVYWYLIRFTGSSPFSYSALDIKSFAMAILKSRFKETTKRNMPKAWFEPLPHTHIALDDAKEQGALFCHLLAESKKFSKLA